MRIGFFVQVWSPSLGLANHSLMLLASSETVAPAVAADTWATDFSLSLGGGPAAETSLHGTTTEVRHMGTPIIYADFHGLRPSSQTHGMSAVPLDSYGSLRDLSNQQVRLQEGLSIVIYADSSEQEDLEADATVYFDSNLGLWLAEIDEGRIRHVPIHASWNKAEFLCIQCRRNLESHFEEQGRNQQTTCPNCGVEITTAVKPP